MLTWLLSKRMSPPTAGLEAGVLFQFVSLVVVPWAPQVLVPAPLVHRFETTLVSATSFTW